MCLPKEHDIPGWCTTLCCDLETQEECYDGSGDGWNPTSCAPVRLYSCLELSNLTWIDMCVFKNLALVGNGRMPQ